MAKLPRVLQKQFAVNALPAEVGVFGSLAAAAPTNSQDPLVIQSLSNWLSGWKAAVLGGNSPAIEDMNGMCLVFAYQLAYLMQAGVAEWDATTTYYIGSMVNSGGVIYISQTDNNLNNAVTSAANWKTQNAALSVYDAIVGTSGQVTAGRATHTSLSSAYAAVAAGSSIFVLPGSVTENLSLTGKQVTFIGAGYGSRLNGTLTLGTGSDKTIFKNMRVSGNVLLDTAASYLTFTENYLDTGATLTDNSTGSYTQWIQL